MKHSANNKEQEEKTMKHTVITALSLILAMFLAGCQIHAGQWQSLIRDGIHAEGRNEDGNSILMQPASSRKPVKESPLLLKLIPAVNGMPVTSETAQFKASQVGDESPPKWFVKSGASLHAVYGTGKTGLIVGAENRNVSSVKALLLPEAEPRSKDSSGAPGIDRARDYENTEVVQALVEIGTAVSACDSKGETVLMTDGATGYQEPPSVPPLTGTEQSVPSPYG